MEIGQEITYNNIVYTIWLVESDCVHAIDSEGNGIAILKNNI